MMHVRDLVATQYKLTTNDHIYKFTKSDVNRQWSVIRIKRGVPCISVHMYTLTKDLEWVCVTQAYSHYHFDSVQDAVRNINSIQEISHGQTPS